MLSSPKKNSDIWAIAGGKGGIGKSFLASSIANYLAMKGNKVVLIDADLGGANLHSFLGMKRPKVSLTDFFQNKTPLIDLMVDSGIENLELVTGNLYSFANNEIKYSQKLKLFRHIKALNKDFIIIDLGGGTHLNTVDTFLLADKMIMVMVPQVIAMENMYYFMKAAIFRKIVRTLKHHGLKDSALNALKSESEDHQNRSLRELIQCLRSSSIEAKDIIDRELSNITIYIILNQIRTKQEIAIGNSIKSICRKYFELDAKYVGYIEYDEFLYTYLNRRLPFMQNYGSSRGAKEIVRLAENLLNNKQLHLAV